MSIGHLSLRHDGPVLVATLDSPPDQYLDAATVVALTDLVEGLRRDRTVRALVLTGAGDNGWPLHYDIAEIAQGSEDVAITLSPRTARAAYAAVRGLARIPGAGAGIDRSPARGILQVARMHATLGGLGRLDQVVIAAIGGSASGRGLRAGAVLRPEDRRRGRLPVRPARDHPGLPARAAAARSGWPAWWARPRPSS